MKKIIILLLVLNVLYTKLSSQTYTSSCVTNPTVQKLYKIDALRLTIARLNATNNPYKDSIEVPQIVYDSVMKALIIMHNIQSSPIKDTVSNIFQFTDFGIQPNTHYDTRFELDSTHVSLVSTGVFGVATKDRVRHNLFEVHIDSNLTWAKQWAAGNYTSTTNVALNNFINKYQLTFFKLPFTFFGQYFFEISTPLAINIRALSKQIPSFASFDYIEPSTYIGDGNIINFEFQANGILATYHNGCGDCLSGCNFWKDWKFFISHTTCDVNYMGVSYQLDLLTNQLGCLRGIITPIEFGNIITTKQDLQNSINFTALTEVNIYGYQIERSSNAKDFEVINTIKAINKNNSNYTAIDKIPLSGNNYYRIKATGYNGEIKYSKTVLLKNDELQLSISPNPVKNYLMVESPKMQQISIINMQGKVVFVQQFNSINQQKINLSALNKGLYIIQVINNTGEIKSKKIVIE